MAVVSGISPGWRAWVGVRLARVRLRALRLEGPISINRIVGSARDLLVCLPLGTDETLPAAQMVHELATTLDIPRIAFVVHQDRASELSGMFSRCEVISYSEEDIGFFGRPRKHLVAQVTDCSWDLAIDLHRPFDFAAAFMCASSGARVRIGFRTSFGAGPRFFNLEYEPRSPEKSPREVYGDLARCVEALCPNIRKQETEGRQ